VKAGPDKPDHRSIQDKIVARRFDDALIDLADVLETDPKNTEWLYMSAVCRRYKTDFESALQLLARLKTLAPEHGRAHQEEGHTYRDMRRPDEALRAYARACRLNPALEASWRGQFNILQSKGHQQQASQIREQLDFLQKLPRPLVGIMDLIAQGRLLKAEEICREFLKKVPLNVEAMRLLADIGMRLGVLDDAEFLLESAVKIEPDNVLARIDYIKALRKRQKFVAALEQAEHLLGTSPNNPMYQSLFAIECMQTGDYDTAIKTFDQILEQLPGDPVTLTSKGHAHKTCGRYDAAVNSYRAALTSQPGYGEAYYSLANLKVYSFSDNQVNEMRAQESSGNLSHADHVYLCFALGKAFEDQEDFETSFKFYERGNSLKKSQGRYTAPEMSADLKAQRDACTAELFARRSKEGHDAPDPIFVLGLPRAGSTLLEQILSSHSQVDGTLELPNILALSQRLRRAGRGDDKAPYPEILNELSGQELEDFGKQYIDDTRIHRQGAPFFIDKMPNNFRHIGLIQSILPNAKLIDARRQPMACCFSGFKQLFAEGQQFTYDLQDLGQYYCDYVELMGHWDKVLPGKVLRVQYEDVVADLEPQVRRILDYCGLPFEEACLNFFNTERSVRTPSSEQVRQPIYQSGLEQWRSFEPWLGPLKDALMRK
jgi:tetratricopeptide (TPR) repeat protein